MYLSKLKVVFFVMTKCICQIESCIFSVTRRYRSDIGYCLSHRLIKELDMDIGHNKLSDHQKFSSHKKVSCHKKLSSHKKLSGQKK